MADYDVIAIVMGRDVDDLDTIVRRVKSIPGVIDVMMMLTLRVLKSDVKYAIAGASGEEEPMSPCGRSLFKLWPRQSVPRGKQLWCAWHGLVAYRGLQGAP
ncbi:MAG: hypothetical protein ABSG92_00730 [Conexivisphaerales archaeon]|jgi:hypothetical protein